MLIRIKPIVDAATGPVFLRAGLVALGLVDAADRRADADRHRRCQTNAGLLVDGAHGTDRDRRGGRDAAGDRRRCCCTCSPTASARPCFSSAGGSCRPRTARPPSPSITGVVGRSRLVGVSFAVGLIVLLGCRRSHVRQRGGHRRGRSPTPARLGARRGMLLIVVAFAALVRHSGRMLLGAGLPARRRLPCPATVAAALLVGVAACDRARRHRGAANRPVPHRGRQPGRYR